MVTVSADKSLAITMGEPAGVGPELTTRLWRDRHNNNLPVFTFIGSSAALRAYDSDIPIQSVTTSDQAIACFKEAIPVIEVAVEADIVAGKIDTRAAPAVIQSIKYAAEKTLAGEFSAMVTNPIHKASLYSAGFSSPGHTEFLASCCNVPNEDAVMMLSCQGLRVVPITVHIALSDVPKTLTADLIVHKAVLTATDLRDRFEITSPKLAISALNPHAGEGGSMGLEEALHIQPAIDRLKDMGIEVSGPHAADTLFHGDARSKYDAALCMYHDQALIPLKTLDFYGGINITLGLPILRTSPDHGTALALAGKGTARTDSLLNAIHMASALARNSCDG